MKQLFTLIIFAFISIMGMASIDVYTNTSWSNLSFSQDIIIHPGATLTLSGNIVMAPDKEIHVLDGGRLIGQDGKISGLSSAENDQWTGIKIDQTTIVNPTTSYGVYFSNFELNDADVAIKSVEWDGEGMQNRKMRFFQTVFHDNGKDVHIVNGAQVNNVALISAFTNSSIVIDRCEFLGSTEQTWPIHIIAVEHLYIRNSKFMDDNASIAVHLRSIVSGNFSNNTFDSDASYCLSFHGPNYGNGVYNNTFDLTDSKVGIDVGAYMAGIYEKMTISGNRFKSSMLGSTSIGISTEQPGQSSNASFKNTTISKNEFENLRIGAILEKMNDANRIEKNTFSMCNKALIFQFSNSDVKIECNTFSRCQTDITINTGSSLMNQNFGYDPSNTFSLATISPFPMPFFNIRNNGSQTFFYHYKFNLPAYTGPVSVNYVNYQKDCSGKKKSLSTEGISSQIKQYPNPASNVLNIDLNGANAEQVEIISSNGQVAIKQPLTSGTNSIDVSGLQPGLYFCNYLNTNGIIQREKVIIK